MDWMKAKCFRNYVPFTYLFDYSLQYTKKSDVILFMTASTAMASYCVLLFTMFRSSVVSLPAGAASCPHSQGFPPAAALVRNLHHGHHSSVSLHSKIIPSYDIRRVKG